MSKMPRHKRHRPAVRRRTPPGTSPGTLAIDPAWPRPQVHAMVYGDGLLQEHGIEHVGQLDRFVGKFPVTWTHVAGMGDEGIMRSLAKRFDIHPLALEDVVNVHQRAKLEEYGDTLFIVTRMLYPQQRDRTSQLSIFIGPGFVLTFAEGTSDALDPVRERLRSNVGRIRTAQPDYLVYAILDAVIDEYFPAVEECGLNLDDLDDEVWTSMRRDTMSRLHEIRNDLLLFHRSIWPQRDLMQLLLRRSHPMITDDTRLYLRDCHDHVLQLLDLLDLYRQLCSDLRDFIVSQAGQRMNEIMKVLTIIATIFMPLSFFAGLWGMNFDPQVSPWNMPELRWRFGYPIALALMGASACSMLWFFWRRGWLGSSPRTSHGDPAHGNAGFGNPGQGGSNQGRANLRGSGPGSAAAARHARASRN